MVTVRDAEEDKVRALEAGASGYVTKNASPKMLLDALRAAAEGRRFIEPDVAQDLALRHVLRLHPRMLSRLDHDGGVRAVAFSPDVA